MKHIQLNGIELALVDEGSGPVVLLLHAFPLDHRIWDAQIEALAASHRVLAPDLRGFGESEVTGGRVGMSQFAADLAALLDTLGVSAPVALAGLSMGGYVALAFWQAYAHRLHALVLCDTRAAADPPEVAAGRLTSADRVLAEGPEFLAQSMLPRLLASKTVQQRPEIVASIRENMLGQDPRGIAAAARGMAVRPDMTAALGRIRCPTLVIVGSEDAASPAAEMRTIADAIPAARFVEIADAGHLCSVEQPNRVSRAMIEFLTEAGTSTGS
jgi:pimeloyl-ACP methyl ester carboxylesterase